MALEETLPAAAGVPAGAIVAANVPAFVAAASLGLAVNFLGNLVIKLSSATTVKLLVSDVSHGLMDLLALE